MESGLLKTMKMIEVNMLINDDDNVFIVSDESHAEIDYIEQNSHAKMTRIYLKQSYDFSKDWSLVVNEQITLPIKMAEVVRTKEFDDAFYYDGDDLGVCYKTAGTTFKLWAPLATKVTLRLFENWHDELAEDISLSRGEKGVWHAHVARDLKGYAYEYALYVHREWRQAVDPYAKTVTINGEKGMIIDIAQTNPPQWPVQHEAIERADAIIYEVHIRDFSIDPRSGLKHKGKYLAFTHSGAKGPAQTTTGIDYLVELGITHVELLPVHDFGSVDESRHEEQYNWGYDPIHYFAPEGSYATDAYNGYSRVRELKALIAALHERNISVILDVVLNHVYIWQQSNFEKITPGYFFRVDDTGKLSDGTGVGNDLASERKMVSKFIADCVEYWATEYNVDGFRFDLMGILDQKTMNEIAHRLERLKRRFLLLGEGWDLPTAYPAKKRAILSEAKRLERYAFFNDRFRDSLKGSPFSLKDTGFISGNEWEKDAALNALFGTVGIAGTKEALFSQPQQAINYVESHDNYTLWDQLQMALEHVDDTEREKMHRLGTTMTLLSQGIPFLHAGQEFFRTKYGVGNSYHSPDSINMLDWKRKAKCVDYIHFVKALISIRKHFAAFRFRSKAHIERHLNIYDFHKQMIAYSFDHLRSFDRCEQLFVVHYSGKHQVDIRLPMKAEWKVIVDEKSANLLPLYTLRKNSLTVKPLSTYVLYRE